MNEDKIKQALLIVMKPQIKDLSEEKLREMLKDKLNPKEIE